jgi:acyl carrier protein
VAVKEALMVSDKLKGILLQELGLDDWAIEDTTTASMVPGWDSLSHARIIAAVEDAYRIRFRVSEVVRLANVGELQALVDERTSR